MMDSTLLSKLNLARHTRRAVMIVRNLDQSSTKLVFENENSENQNAELTDEIARGFQTGKSRSLIIDSVEYFLNVFLPPPRVVVIGAVHITQSLVQLAQVAGYDLEVIDPRTAFATAERFENVKIFADWPQDVLKDNPLDRYCALIAVTHDPKIDDFPIIQALENQCFYVGALGSRKTHSKRVTRLTEAGLDEENIARIHAPIGVNISASGPAEIAISIMAQVVGAFRTRGN